MQTGMEEFVRVATKKGLWPVKAGDGDEESGDDDSEKSLSDTDDHSDAGKGVTRSPIFGPGMRPLRCVATSLSTQT